MSYRRKWYGTAKERKADEEKTPSACARQHDEVPLVNDIRDGRSPLAVDLLHRASLPAIEVDRKPGEAAAAAARRFIELQTGCYGD